MQDVCVTERDIQSSILSLIEREKHLNRSFSETYPGRARRSPKAQLMITERRLSAEVTSSAATSTSLFKAKPSGPF
jgi:hypothetical protein